MNPLLYGTFKRGIASASTPAASYEAAVLADSPIGYWRLRDAGGSGVAVDSSGSGNNGTNTGVAFGVTASPIVTDPGFCGEFTEGDKIVAANIPGLGDGEFSYEFFAKVTSYAQFHSPITICSGGVSAPAQLYFNIGINSGKLTLGLGNGGGEATNPIEPAAQVAGVWRYYCFTWSRILQFYSLFRASATEPCALIASGNIGVVTGDDAAPVTIGNRPDGATPFLGPLAEIAVYDHRLFLADCQTHVAAAGW